jgi:biotin transport system substrate-specific component
MLATGWPLAEAVEKGVVPFLLGDLIKAAGAGLLLPGAWQLLGER